MDTICPTCSQAIRRPAVAAISEREAARYLGLSEPTLRRHRRDGTGPRYVRLSANRLGYRPSDLDAWLEERLA